MTDEELKIVRAINFCIQCYDKINAHAIKDNTTIGELYVKVSRENVNNFFKIWKENEIHSRH